MDLKRILEYLDKLIREQFTGSTQQLMLIAIKDYILTNSKGE